VSIVDDASAFKVKSPWLVPKVPRSKKWRSTVEPVPPPRVGSNVWVPLHVPTTGSCGKAMVERAKEMITAKMIFFIA
jgi:hypothetical protein